jgi:hypothetical protein
MVVAAVLLCGPDGRPATQVLPPVPSQAPAHPAAVRSVPPALLVKLSDEAPSQPLSLARLDVQVRITGFIAETTTTLTFRNDRDRALEGELVFPLPEGAAVSGYALDVGGELLDGVIVEHHEARIAFEKEVRKGIDPGLLEWVQGNNFRTRVWPIPAHGRRTVRVRYLSALVTREDGGRREALYTLPLRFRALVDEANVEVSVVKSPAPPAVRGGAPQGFAFERWEQHYVARAVLHDARLDEDLLIALPELPRENVVVERGEGGETFFVIDDFPALPEAAPLRLRRVGVFWDASLSREGEETRRELELLASWLRRAGDVDVDLVVFRNVAEAPRAFAVRGGDVSALVAFLDTVPYDGGTSLAGVRPLPGEDFALLFSDGLANLGDNVPAASDVPLYAISGDSRANHALLGHLARMSGGEELSLQQLGVEEVLRSIGRRSGLFRGVDAAPGAVADIAPSGARPVHGHLTLSGRLMAPEAVLTLRYGSGAEAQSRRYTLRQADAVAGDLVARLWAQQRVAELSVFPERNHDALLSLGRRYSLVTPGTSLLVLESVGQYLEHGIEPPASRAALRAEYQRRVQERQAVEKRKQADKLQRVIGMWEQRLAWWQREFPHQPGFRWQEGPVSMSGALPAESRPDAERPASGAAPPPPPPASVMPGPLQRADAVAAAKAKPEPGSQTSAGPTIALKAWDPDTPYLTAMKQAAPSAAYAAYLAERRQYGGSPAFFLDCADFLLRAGQRERGVRVLTSVAELGLEEPRLLRIAAHRLQQIGEGELAIVLFEKVLRLRPEEPQSLRDLALALGERADERWRRGGRIEAAAAADYLRAVELLNRIVMGEWDQRFPEVEVIALEEANRMIALLAAGGVLPKELPIDLRLRRALDLDVRIVLTWDTDLTDMDLWVTEPSGEKCFYSHPLTTVGAMISRDFTGGYGPEEYLVRRALGGEYRIQANFYGSRSQSLTGPTTLQATVITNFGRPNEERKALTLRLAGAKDVVDVGVIRFEAGAKVTP